MELWWLVGGQRPLNPGWAETGIMSPFSEGKWGASGGRSSDSLGLAAGHPCALYSVPFLFSFPALQPDRLRLRTTWAVGSLLMLRVKWFPSEAVKRNTHRKCRKIQGVGVTPPRGGVRSPCLEQIRPCVYLSIDLLFHHAGWSASTPPARETRWGRVCGVSHVCWAALRLQALPLRHPGPQARLAVLGAALAAPSQVEKALEGAGHFWHCLGWGPPGAMEGETALDRLKLCTGAPSMCPVWGQA